VHTPADFASAVKGATFNMLSFSIASTKLPTWRLLSWQLAATNANSANSANSANLRGDRRVAPTLSVLHSCLRSTFFSKHPLTFFQSSRFAASEASEFNE